MMAVADNPMHHDAYLRLLEPSAWAREALRAEGAGWPLTRNVKAAASIIVGRSPEDAGAGDTIINSADKLRTPAQINLEQAINKEDDDE